MNQQFGAWLRAPPFSATRKKVISVPGFFAKKKSGSSSHTSSNSPIWPPSEHQHDEREQQLITNHTPSKVTDVTSDNQGANAVCVGGHSTQSIIEGNKAVPLTQIALNDDFEQLIQNLDNEINCFNGVTDSQGSIENLRPVSAKATPATEGPHLGPNFKNSTLQNLEPTPQCGLAKMDHDPVQIKAQSEGKWLRIQRPTHLKEIQNFEVNLGCSAIENKVWGSPSPNASMVLTARKIKACGDSLLVWSRQSFGNVKKQLETLGKKLSLAEIRAANGLLDFEVVKGLKTEINELLDRESQMWQQRSRAFFLQCGDHNTSYFHSKASHRFRRNRIMGLRNSSNSWCTEDHHIRKIACDYYRSLFTSSQPSEFSDILNQRASR
nr:hypothetical protein CFP56_00044 [Quercus suber]